MWLDRTVTLDLWAPFDLSLRFGVFNTERAAGLGQGIMEVELDARGPDPLQFYGCYARFEQGGLNTFVSKRGPGDAAATNVGQHFEKGDRPGDRRDPPAGPARLAGRKPVRRSP